MIEQTAGSGAVQNGTATAILAGGLVAGAIDIAYAFAANYLQSGMSPTRVLQAVASGLIGRDAFQGGAAAAALGLVLHFAMTVAMAAIFLAAVRALPPLRQHMLLAGLVYGGLIYFAMRWVIVPLSGFPGDLRTFGALEFAVHVLGVGLVIALAVRRFAPIP
ncbi:hypothetical protein [Sphingosinicella sp. CPCC 101087]|uniref:hypothetical protein n=1 Tax=Sphingosinicella sp. CPCC 101087 TaxID=2497754 RepID=UPI00101C1D57|nr:hypothetical protein [Sphingosinicella sp. CPCC 101087]